MTVRRRKNARANWAAWCVAVLLAMLWVALWNLIPLPSSTPSPSPPATPSMVRYMPLDRHGDVGAANALQAVWSPVLFSLPGRLGITHPLLDESRLDITPPLASAEENVFFFDTPQSHKEPETAVPVTASAGLAVTRLAQPPPLDWPPLSPDFEAHRTAAHREGIVRIQGPLDKSDLYPIDWPAVRFTKEVAAVVEINERGEAVHVFLERPPEDPRLARDMLSALYRLRTRKPVTACTLRVVWLPHQPAVEETN